jgi:glycosyltransferase involved in cell wall biosynthesis
MDDVAGKRPTLLHVFSTFAVGGPQTRFATIVNRLGPKYRHLIASMSGVTEAIGLLSPEVEYLTVPVFNARRNVLGNILRFRKELTRLNPDLVVTYNWGALEWAIANRFGPRLPAIHVEDGFGPDEAETRLQRRVWLRRLGLGHGTTIIVPSRNLQQIATKEWRFPETRVTYIPNGVDVARFSAPVPEADRAFVKAHGEIIVGTCAALRKEKNLGRLISAFAACGARNARLVICGDGPERRTLESAAINNGIANRVVFTGYLSQPERALVGFDLFAMSSDTEQMPIGLLEAMAAGLPAVATDVGDIKSIVSQPNRAYVVNAADTAALTGALRTLLGDPVLRGKISEANRTKVRTEFSIDMMVAAYDRLFEQGVAKRRTAA